MTLLNKRDEQIAAINANVEGLREDRLVACRGQILTAYRAASIIDKLARVTEIADREPSDFHVLTKSDARLDQNFNDDSYHWDYYCEQIGRSIALAEERYIFQELDKVGGRGKSIDATRPTFEAIAEGAVQLSSAGFSPTVLIAPITLFVALLESLKIDWEKGEWVVLPSGQRLELFWSSNVAPINRFVVLDRRAGEWKVKLGPESKERLTVAIGRPSSPPQAVTFLAETVVKYEISDPAGFYVIDVEGEPPDEYDMTRQ